MFSLAPKARSRSRSKISSSAVKTTDMTICMEKQPPSIFSAEPLSPLPMDIDALGAPPALTNAANAEIIMIIGRHTPTPVSARLPSPGI